MSQPLLRRVDCVMLRAADLDAAVRFYSERLGHPVIWRTDEAVAFRLPETDAELVVNRRTGPETDFMVDNAERAHERLVAAGQERSRRRSTLPSAGAW